MRDGGRATHTRRASGKAFQRMTRYRPDLVIRLNVDLDTACRRKPDHRRELLRAKIAVTPRLSYKGAPIVDIDANRPLAEVLIAVKAAVAGELARHGRAS